jgi:hypothetical protein
MFIRWRLTLKALLQIHRNTSGRYAHGFFSGGPFKAAPFS